MTLTPRVVNAARPGVVLVTGGGQGARRSPPGSTAARPPRAADRPRRAHGHGRRSLDEAAGRRARGDRREARRRLRDVVRRAGWPTPAILMLRPRSGEGQSVMSERYRIEPELPIARVHRRPRQPVPADRRARGPVTISVDADGRRRRRDRRRRHRAPRADRARPRLGAAVPPARAATARPTCCSPEAHGDHRRRAARLPAGRGDPVVDRARGHATSTAPARCRRGRSTRSRRGAGVCRDFAHLGIALCRSLDIPARMVVGYLHELEPMDQHAWFEAFVGGRWFTFDATQREPRGNRVAVAYGRDAADVALVTQFGPMELTAMEVWVRPAEPRRGDRPAPSRVAGPWTPVTVPTSRRRRSGTALLGSTGRHRLRAAVRRRPGPGRALRDRGRRPAHRLLQAARRRRRAGRPARRRRGRRAVAARRDAMFAGEPINVTEDRAVLHVALRAPRGTEMRRRRPSDDVVPDVHDVLDAHGGASPSGSAAASGSGADGPAHPHRRQHRHRRLRPRPGDGVPGARPPTATPSSTCRFVSNVDGADIAGALADLDPAETLFVVSSKTFTTIETLTNARTARDWLTSTRSARTPSPATSSPSARTPRRWPTFGIDTANMFGFWEWVGGRYSVDSAIGLSLMIAIGPERFAELLAGFRVVDEHFRRRAARRQRAGRARDDRDLERQRARLRRPRPCCRTPRSWPASRPTCSSSTWSRTASRCALDGSPVTLDTGPIVWGEPGTNGQHAFYQLLHQGTRVVPVDFIGFATPAPPAPRPPRPADGQPVRPGRGAGVRPRPTRRAVAVVRRRPAVDDDPRRRS